MRSHFPTFCIIEHHLFIYRYLTIIAHCNSVFLCRIGLGFVYTINAILATIVAVKVAPDRGQPSSLWSMKTFTVGGLAFDQLMQLPTLIEIEKANAVKGSRAIKKKQSIR